MMDVPPIDVAGAMTGGTRSDLPRTPVEAAREFEALLLTQLLKVMRESVESSGLFEEMPGQEIYLELMDHEVARALVHQGGIGLSAILEKSLSVDSHSKPTKTNLSSAAERVAPGEQSSSAERGLEPPVGHQQSPVISPRELLKSGLFRLSSDIGWRRDPISGQLRYHNGLDLAAAEGTKVSSLSEGKVLFSGKSRGYGNLVVVESEDGTRIRYAHLSRLEVAKGDRVTRHQMIGRVGSTGRATGPHLHLEIERPDHSGSSSGHRRIEETQGGGSFPENALKSK